MGRSLRSLNMELAVAEVSSLEFIKRLITCTVSIVSSSGAQRLALGSNIMSDILFPAKV